MRFSHSLRWPRLAWLWAILPLALVLAACGGNDDVPATAAPSATPSLAGQEIVVYSGRGEVLVKAVLEAFTKSTGIKVRTRYASTAALAATILEEGNNSPADVYWAQDAGALGALSSQGKFSKLPDDLLGRVESRFRSPKGEWVGVTGRARVVAYNTRKLTERDLPDSIFGFTDPKWKGRIGWPPTNGSFQAFVTALRVQEGDQRARQWLEGIKANQPKAYSNNTTALEAVASGEVDVAFINHYYLYTQLVQKGPSYPVRNYYPRAGDAGAMVNVAGVGVLASSKHREAALRLVDYLLSPEAQRYFAGETPEDAYEYPLVKGVPTHPDLQPLASIKTPQIDLGSLSDLDGTLKMLREVGLIS